MNTVADTSKYLLRNRFICKLQQPPSSAAESLTKAEMLQERSDIYQVSAPATNVQRRPPAHLLFK